MEEYYKIMSDILDVEYKMKAIIYVLDELEHFYSEETAFKEKSLLTVIKGSLSCVLKNVSEIITCMDKMTAEGKVNKQQ